MRQKLSLFPLLFVLILVVVTAFDDGIRAVEFKWKGDLSAYIRDSTAPGAKTSFEHFATNLFPHAIINDKITFDGQLHYMMGVIADYQAMGGESGSGGSGEGRHIDYRSQGDWGLFSSYLTYKFDDVFWLRGGLFLTPFGFQNQNYYVQYLYVTTLPPGLFSVYRRLYKRPEHVGTNYQRIAQGVWATGRYSHFNYDVYVTNGRSQFGTPDDDNAKGGGGRLGFDIPVSFLDRIYLMYSGYADTFREPSVDVNTFNKQITHMGSLEIVNGNAKVQSEFSMSTRAKIPMSAYYVLAQYTFFNDWTSFVKHEYFDPNRDISDNQERYLGGGVVYHVVPWKVLTKFEVDRKTTVAKGSTDLRETMFHVGFSAGF